MIMSANVVFSNHVILDKIFGYIGQSNYLNFASVNKTILNTIKSDKKSRSLCREAAEEEAVTILAKTYFEKKYEDQNLSFIFCLCLSAAQLNNKRLLNLNICKMFPQYITLNEFDDEHFRMFQDKI